MKRIWLVVGVTILTIAAFFAGWFLSRPMFFGGPDAMTFREEGPGGEVREFQGSGETFAGSIAAIEDGVVAVTNETGEFEFQVTSNTRVIDLGESDGLHVGDSVDVIYEAQNGDLIALTITSTH